MLYQGSMVQAILRDVDPKTITRRAVKGEALDWLEAHNFTPEFVAHPENRFSPYGHAGDQIQVRETFFAWGRWETRFSAKKGRDEWNFIDLTRECGKDYLYAADGVSDTQAFIKRRSGVEPMYWKRPAIFMPSAASRITLEVTGVRVERLQAISEADAMAEGVDACDGLLDTDEIFRFAASMRLSPEDCKPWYAALWESINGLGSWDANPWVWCVSFKRVAPC
jgi:hypothetical protein